MNRALVSGLSVNALGLKREQQSCHVWRNPGREDQKSPWQLHKMTKLAFYVT